MPYSGISDSKLPARVKRSNEKKRQAFVSAFNSTFKRTNGDESAAFSAAYTAMTKVKAVKPKKNRYITAPKTMVIRPVEYSYDT